MEAGSCYDPSGHRGDLFGRLGHARLSGLSGALCRVHRRADLAGADKFFGLLTNWEQYLAPAVANIVPAHTFMLVVGAVEIAAGLLVAVMPRIGAYVVCAWLLGIILNLLMLGAYYDIALRDLGLAIGAFALGRLSEEYSK